MHPSLRFAAKYKWIYICKHILHHPCQLCVCACAWCHLLPLQVAHACHCNSQSLRFVLLIGALLQTTVDKLAVDTWPGECETGSCVIYGHDAICNNDVTGLLLVVNPFITT